MEINAALDGFSALSQPTRLAAFRLLIQAGAEGMAAGDIGSALDVRQNTLSANLSVLLTAGLIRNERQGRSIRYYADLDGLRRLLGFLLQDCCGGRPELCQPLIDEIAAAGYRMPEVPAREYNVLFLCTGNSARSLIGEAILNTEGRGRFRAFSAGSAPKEEPHPYTLELLQRLRHDTVSLRSKSWDEFAGPDAPSMDFVFTVCDQAAAEACPVWPGQPMTAHWGIPDPAAATGSEAERRFAFLEAYRMLSTRISLFLSLPVASLDKLALQRRLDHIGRATDRRDD
jgi:ArsR family transcriptional regulator, arsenate/arsenite/antimonite-responsive transcriptional repressor / arsenate reductase (thioredoxin)